MRIAKRIIVFTLAAIMIFGCTGIAASAALSDATPEESKQAEKGDLIMAALRWQISNDRYMFYMRVYGDIPEEKPYYICGFPDKDGVPLGAMPIEELPESLSHTISAIQPFKNNEYRTFYGYSITDEDIKNITNFVIYKDGVFVDYMTIQKSGYKVVVEDKTNGCYYHEYFYYLYNGKARLEIGSYTVALEYKGKEYQSGTLLIYDDDYGYDHSTFHELEDGEKIAVYGQFPNTEVIEFPEYIEPEPVIEQIKPDAYLMTSFLNSDNALMGIAIQFDGEQPDMQMSDLTSFKLERDGIPINMEFKKEIRKTTEPYISNGEALAQTHYFLDFTGVYTKPGTYIMYFTHMGVDRESNPITIVSDPVPEPEEPVILTAKPTSSTVYINGTPAAFDAYNINDNNYFKLRDLAYILSGTEAQFEVEWDGKANAISLTSGQSYTVVGGEMEGKGSGAKTPAPTNSKILLDGEEVAFTAYNIEDNNYFKLRDIGEALDFSVEWDGENNAILIDTSKGYTAP